MTHLSGRHRCRWRQWLGAIVLAGGAVLPFGAAASAAALDKLADLGEPIVDAGREWTLMVYMAADNDLEPFALQDLIEMQLGLPETGVEVVVLVDRAEGFADGDGDWTETRLYRIRRDADTSRIGSELVASPGEVNMGDPATLAAFLQGSIARYPARQYGLVLWDHGGGWSEMAHDNQAPGAESGRDALSVVELGAAVREGLTKAKLEKLALIGFDMCLMAQLETAYEIRDLAEVMVASQAVEPGDGWPYQSVLQAFGKGTLGARRLGAGIVEAYRAHYEAAGATVATQSALDLSAIASVVAALDAISRRAGAATAEAWPEISRSMFYSETYSDRTDVRLGAGAVASVDLLDLAKRLRHNVAGLEQERGFADLVSAMDRAVLANYASPRHRLSHGLAVYAPVTQAQFSADYRATALARDAHWPGFLADLYRQHEAHLTPPKIVALNVTDFATGKPTTGGKVGGGFGVEATVEGENVLWVQAMTARRDETNKGLLIFDKGYVADPQYYNKKKEAVADAVDLVMPEFRGRRNVVSAEFTGFRFFVSNGEIAARATLDGSNLKDVAHLGVPTIFERAEVGRHFATVFFDMLTWEASHVVGQIRQPDGRVTYRQFKPVSDDKVTLLFEFHPDGGGDVDYLNGETMTWGRGLELIVGSDEPGKYIVAMQAESIGGRSDFAATHLNIEEMTAQEKGFLDNAKQVKPEHLIGRWRWHKLEGTNWTPVPLLTEIRRSERNQDVLLATTTSEQDASFGGETMGAFLDTRLTPTLRLVSYDGDGRPVEAQNYTMLVSRWENDSPRMILKYLVPAGWLVLLAKEDAAARQTAPAAPPPAPAPPQPQAAPQASLPQPSPPAAPQQTGLSLAGVWQSSDGAMLAMDHQRYELYEDNVLVDAGAYAIQGNQLTIVDADGERESFLFQGDTNQFAIQDEDGEVTYFRRLR